MFASSHSLYPFNAQLDSRKSWYIFPQWPLVNKYLVALRLDEPGNEIVIVSDHRQVKAVIAVAGISPDRDHGVDFVVVAEVAVKPGGKLIAVARLSDVWDNVGPVPLQDFLQARESSSEELRVGKLDVGESRVLDLRYGYPLLGRNLKGFGINLT